jgi:hypothetical protein
MKGSGSRPGARAGLTTGVATAGGWSEVCHRPRQYRFAVKRSGFLRCVAASLVLAIAPLAACSGEDEGDDRADTLESTTSTTPQEDTPTTEDASVDPSAALLALEDLPTGYSVEPDDDDEEETPTGCQQLRALDEANGEPLAKAEVTFAAGQFGPFINHQVSVLTEGTAEGQFEEFRSAINQPSCQEFTDETEDGQTATYTLRPLSAPALGDQTVALRMTGDEPAFNITYDFVAERIGDTVSFLGVASVPVLGGGPPSLEPLARRADEKLQAA